MNKLFAFLRRDWQTETRYRMSFAMQAFGIVLGVVTFFYLGHLVGVVGKTDLIEDLLVVLLSEGHFLLEGVPGVAKTTIGKTFSHALGLEFKRIQGSPDTLPADIVGTHVFDSKTGSFKLEKGPIFSNILLIDEINRNTPKTNSAVLEAMQEKQATIEGETQRLPYPFMVIATQSPIDFHGVFPMPEVLVDRFLMSVKVGYPSAEEEIEITDRIYSIEAGLTKQVITNEQISHLTKLARDGGDIFEIVRELEPDIITIGYDQPFEPDHLERELAKRGLKAKVVRLPHLDHDLDGTRKIISKIIEFHTVDKKLKEIELK